MHADAVAAARVLRRLPTSERDIVLREMLDEARGTHAKRLAACWFGIGDGTLMDVALTRGPVPEPLLSDGDYCRCLAAVYAALAEAQPFAQETQVGVVGSTSSRAVAINSPHSAQ